MCVESAVDIAVSTDTLVTTSVERAKLIAVSTEALVTISVETAKLIAVSTEAFNTNPVDKAVDTSLTIANLPLIVYAILHYLLKIKG
jgi:hypothetical protein